MGLVERLQKNKLNEIVEKCIENEYDLLILDFTNLSQKEVKEKIQNISLTKEKIYIVLKGIDKNNLKTEDFIEIYEKIFTQQVYLYIYRG